MTSAESSLAPKTFMWAPENDLGLEALAISEGDTTILGDGVVIGIAKQLPFRLHYSITLDKGWHTRIVKVTVFGSRRENLELHSDGAGHWCSADGKALDDLDGCLDVDLSATAFTNTLPIRRNYFKQGQAAEIVVAYVSVPDLDLKSARQRYTCLNRQASGARYLYEGLSTGFRQEIEVDSEGFVVHYPRFSHRVWPRGA